MTVSTLPYFLIDATLDMTTIIVGTKAGRRTMAGRKPALSDYECQDSFWQFSIAGANYAQAIDPCSRTGPCMCICRTNIVNRQCSDVR